MTLSHILLPELGKFTLDRVCKELKVVNAHHHRAIDDAEATSKVFFKLLDMLKERDVKTMDDLNALGSTSPDAIKRTRHTMGSSWQRMRSAGSICTGSSLSRILRTLREDRVCR